jgi:hypothetical protein
MNTTFLRIGIVFLVSVVLIHTYLMNLSLTWRAPAPAKSLSHLNIETSQVETPNVILSKMPSNQSSRSTTSNQLEFHDLAVLILACNRQTALDYALLSLSRSYYSNQTSIREYGRCLFAGKMVVVFKVLFE